MGCQHGGNWSCYHGCCRNRHFVWVAELYVLSARYSTATCCIFWKRYLLQSELWKYACPPIATSTSKRAYAVGKYAFGCCSVVVYLVETTSPFGSNHGFYSHISHGRTPVLATSLCFFTPSLCVGSMENEKKIPPFDKLSFHCNEYTKSCGLSHAPLDTSFIPCFFRKRFTFGYRCIICV